MVYCTAVVKVIKQINKKKTIRNNNKKHNKTFIVWMVIRWIPSFEELHV